MKGLLSGLIGIINGSTGSTSNQCANSQAQSASQQQGALQGSNNHPASMGQGLNHAQWQQQGLAAWIPQGSSLQNMQLNNQIGQIATYQGQQPQFFNVNRQTQEQIDAETRVLIDRWLQIDPVEREAYLILLRAKAVEEKIYGPSSFWYAPPTSVLTLEQLQNSHNTDVLEKEILDKPSDSDEN